MRRIGGATVLAVMVASTVVASEPAAPGPVTVSLVPPNLADSTGDVLRVTCTVSNISDQQVTLFLGEPRVSLGPETIEIDTAGWQPGKAQRLILLPGESRNFPIVLTQGREIPLLDPGEYRLCVEVRLAKAAPVGLAWGKAQFAVKGEGGQNADRLTLKRIIRIAREYSEKNRGTQKIDYDSYRISRYIDDWDVAFFYRGPDLFGTQTISVKTRNQAAYVRPIL